MTDFTRLLYGADITIDGRPVGKLLDAYKALGLFENNERAGFRKALELGIPFRGRAVSWALPGQALPFDKKTAHEPKRHTHGEPLLRGHVLHALGVVRR